MRLTFIAAIHIIHCCLSLTYNLQFNLFALMDTGLTWANFCAYFLLREGFGVTVTKVQMNFKPKIF